MNPPGRQVIIKQNSKFPGTGCRTISHAVMEVTMHRRWWIRTAKKHCWSFRRTWMSYYNLS